MSQEEKYGERDMSYSVWHRRMSTRRYVGIEKAQLLAMVDMDVVLWVEYEDDNKHPIALIETAIYIGKQSKPYTITKALAERAHLPAFVCLYTLSSELNPADKSGKWKDIKEFRVKRIFPNEERMWRLLTPHEWARNLLRMREWTTHQFDLDGGYLIDDPKPELDL